MRLQQHGQEVDHVRRDRFPKKRLSREWNETFVVPLALFRTRRPGEGVLLGKQIVHGLPKTPNVSRIRLRVLGLCLGLVRSKHELRCPVVRGELDGRGASVQLIDSFADAHVGDFDLPIAAM